MTAARDTDDFTSIPVLDYTQLHTGRKAQFVAALQHALVNVGFLYLAHPPLDPSLVAALCAYAPRLFELPQARKDALRMANSPCFLGYSRVGAELTRGAPDQREQFDFATRFGEGLWMPGAPEYLRLFGDAQWPEEDDLPGFKDVMQRYLAQLEQLSYEFISLIAEALGLPASGLNTFFDVRERMQHRAKVVKYPPLAPSTSSDEEFAQGVGAHFDAGFLTLLLQASVPAPGEPYAGLEVQAPGGAWVPAPPKPDTLVVNFGKGLEAATRGLARATSHRVRSPPAGAAPRFSVPFFQRIGQGVHLTERVPTFPTEILKLRDERGQIGPTDSINYAEYSREPSGQVELIGRIKSHPDVAERHYPALFKQYFPDGLPAHGKAY
ncbi:hypothetical protein M0805_003551 [Coniferiporia weirii]|nr:hypothetical protein M0805_003551 [Coniferiporia weirii]